MKKLPAIEGGSPVREDFLVFGKPQIHQADIEEVVDTLKSGWWGTGPKTHRFEEEFARYTTAGYALALNSCTAGMHLALDVMGVSKSDEVITTPMTFVSTANVILHLGATPVFADVDMKSGNIDPAEVERKITPRTKVILPVHLHGRPCEMEVILELAKEHGLLVLEDAAHAVESYYRGRKIGSIGDITAFSFYVTKNVATGEGGMLTTNRIDWYDEMRIKSLHGISKDAWKRYSEEGFQPYEAIYPGYKYNMTDIQAAIGIHQLARVEQNLKLRQRFWRIYDEALAEVPELITPPSEEEDTRHARHIYAILLRLENLKIDRNQFIDALRAERIGTGVHFTALHLHKFYRERFGFQRGDFPNAEYISDRTVSLPLSAAITEEDVNDVIEVVVKLVKYYRKW